MLLIYGHTLRNSDYSEEEAAVGQSLINLYYNFAKYSKAVYNDVKLDRSKPNDIKCLEISKTEKIVQIDEHFGKGDFWDIIEKTLKSDERTYFDEL